MLGASYLHKKGCSRLKSRTKPYSRLIQQKTSNNFTGYNKKKCTRNIFRETTTVERRNSGRTVNYSGLMEPYTGARNLSNCGLIFGGCVGMIWNGRKALGEMSEWIHKEQTLEVNLVLGNSCRKGEKGPPLLQCYCHKYHDSSIRCISLPWLKVT